MQNEQYAFIVNFSEISYSTLRKFRVASKQALSWNINNISKDGLTDLLIATAIFNEAPLYVDKEVDLSDNFDSLDECVYNALKIALAESIAVAQKNGDAKISIIFNLMPFTLAPSIADKLIAGICYLTNDEPLLKSFHLIFLTRNIDYFSTCNNLKGAISEGILSNSISFIDIRGYTLFFKETGAHSSKLDLIPRSIFF